MWPVIERELRSEARRPFNHWLRVIAAAALLAGLWMAFRRAGLYEEWISRMAAAMARNTARGLPPPLGAAASPARLVFGSALFGYINALLFTAIWILVPLLTADSLSRERREGTLGLLFLTPLTARGVVVGKCFVHGLRALTLYLTMLPMLAVPVLLGGVSMNDLLMAALVNGCALVVALAVGLQAACVSRDWMKVVIVAELASFAFAVLFMLAYEGVFGWAVRTSASVAAVTPAATSPWGWLPGPWAYPMPRPASGVLSWVGERFAFSANLLDSRADLVPTRSRAFVSGGPWSVAWTAYPPSMHTRWFLGVGFLLLASVAWLGVVVELAARDVNKFWHEQGASRKAEALRRVYATPRLWKGWLRRRLAGALRRNPIGWLEQYSWKARLTKWGWCLFVVVTECFLSRNLDDLPAGQLYLGGVLVGGLAFSAAGSFRRELESRVLELLVITPLQEWRILWGRLCGIWTQFLPALLVVLLAASYAQGMVGYVHYEVPLFCAELVVAVVALPVIGLYFSLRRWNTLAAWLGTCGYGLLVPVLAVLPMESWLVAVGPTADLTTLAGLQLGTAAIFGGLAVERLAKRRFAFA